MATTLTGDAPALLIDGLVKRYGAVEAVRGITLEVHRGEVFGLLGRNGAGKTTTVECAIGLRRADAGRILVAGVDVGKEPARAREHIGVQLQATALQDKITPRQALRLFGAFYRNPADVSELLERFDLKKKADAAFDTLSGGQKQRLALALAVLNRPDVIFLDEPTAGLDAEAKRDLHGMILELHGAGRTVILTTHDIAEAGRLCDRIAVIDRGDIVTTGRPLDLVKNAPGRAAVIVRTGTRLEERAIRGVAGVTGAHWRDEAWRLETGNVTGTIMDVAKLVEEAGNELLDLQIHRPTLEDAFLELLRERDAQAAPAARGAA